MTETVISCSVEWWIQCKPLNCFYVTFVIFFLPLPQCLTTKTSSEKMALTQLSHTFNFGPMVLSMRVFVRLCDLVSLFFWLSLVSKPRATGRVVAMEFWHHFINKNRWVWEVNMGWSCWRVLGGEKWTLLYRNNLHFPLSHTCTCTHAHKAHTTLDKFIWLCWHTCLHKRLIVVIIEYVRSK